MTRLFEVWKLSIIFSLVAPSCGNRNNGKIPSSGLHYTNLIVGGGAAGLYTAWRLSSRQSKTETTAIYEWSPVRLGGRIFTKRSQDGQILELGAMRLTAQDLVLNQLLVELNLTDYITDFPMTDNRLYYLRGVHMYQNEIARKGVPYNTIYRKKDTDSLFTDIKEKIAPNVSSRADWCRFFDEGMFPSNVTSNAYNKNDTVRNIGYWNLLSDQLGNEGVQYATDASGWADAVTNGNAAYFIYISGKIESSTKYRHLKPGYSKLIDTLEQQCLKKHVEIKKGKRLTKFHWNAKERRFYCTFMSHNENGQPSQDIVLVTSDRLFLCVPKRSVDLIEETDVVGDNWPGIKERRVLKHSLGRFYIDSVIQQPMYRILLTYDHPWWLNCTYKPDLKDSTEEEKYKSKSSYNCGPTITDLPLRQIYYFANTNEFQTKPTFSLLASYNDARYAQFWEELEVPPNESLRNQDPSLSLQPLFSGTKITDAMHRVVRRQLNSVHYTPSEGMQVPLAEEGYFMDWRHDPYGAGFHLWKAHYKIAEAQYYMTRPSELINVEVPLHVAGEAYSNDEGWIEGALTTAESILVDKIRLKPFLNYSSSFYPLICYPDLTSKK